MNAEMIAALREIETERNISFESLLEALESALISAYKRNFGAEANAVVAIDRQTWIAAAKLEGPGAREMASILVDNARQLRDLRGAILRLRMIPVVQVLDRGPGQR